MTHNSYLFLTDRVSGASSSSFKSSEMLRLRFCASGVVCCQEENLPTAGNINTEHYCRDKNHPQILNMIPDMVVNLLNNPGDHAVPAALLCISH